MGVFKQFLVSLVLVTLISGCATNSYLDAPPRLGGFYSLYLKIGYDGPIRSIDDVGVVTTDGILRIQSIDGVPARSYRTFSRSGFYSGGRYQLHLLPGTYRLEASYYFDKGNGYRTWSTLDRTHQITISKGEVLHLAWDDSGRSWRIANANGESARREIEKDFKELIKSGS